MADGVGAQPGGRSFQITDEAGLPTSRLPGQAADEEQQSLIDPTDSLCEKSMKLMPVPAVPRAAGGPIILPRDALMKRRWSNGGM